MSYSTEVYVGQYIKVYLPEVEIEKEYLTCPNESCNKYGSNYLSSKFCPDCGIELQFKKFKTKQRYNLDQLLYDCFEPDTFFNLPKDNIIDSDIEDFSIILPNKPEQGGITLGNNGIYDIPEKVEHTNWVELKRVLDKEDLKFDECFGIIRYCW